MLHKKCSITPENMLLGVKGRNCWSFTSQLMKGPHLSFNLKRRGCWHPRCLTKSTMWILYRLFTFLIEFVFFLSPSLLPATFLNIIGQQN